MGFDNKKSMVVQLSGGLGNQLFQYVSGVAIAAKTNRIPLFDVSQLDNGTMPHASDIRNLKGFENFVDIKKSWSKPKYFWWRTLLLAERLFPKFYHRLAFLPQIYTSRTVGFDPQVGAFTRLRFLRGYFQSWRYLDFAKDRLTIAALEPKQQSDWYRSLASEMALESSLVLHLRRGDFLTQGADWGVLSEDYYAKGLEHIYSRRPLGTIYVFSDDIAMAKEELAGTLSGYVANVRWIEPPAQSTAEESISLMSLAPAIVTANSTFSWWAASLGPERKLVVAPAQWFRGKGDPDELIPPTWIRVQSSWLEPYAN